MPPKYEPPKEKVELAEKQITANSRVSLTLPQIWSIAAAIIAASAFAAVQWWRVGEQLVAINQHIKLEAWTITDQHDMKQQWEILNRDLRVPDARAIHRENHKAD